MTQDDGVDPALRAEYLDAARRTAEAISSGSQPELADYTRSLAIVFAWQSVSDEQYEAMAFAESAGDATPEDVAALAAEGQVAFDAALDDVIARHQQSLAEFDSFQTAEQQRGGGRGGVTPTPPGGGAHPPSTTPPVATPGDWQRRPSGLYVPPGAMGPGPVRRIWDSSRGVWILVGTVVVTQVIIQGIATIAQVFTNNSGRPQTVQIAPGVNVVVPPGWTISQNSNGGYTLMPPGPNGPQYPVPPNQGQAPPVNSLPPAPPGGGPIVLPPAMTPPTTPTPGTPTPGTPTPAPGTPTPAPGRPAMPAPMPPPR